MFEGFLNFDWSVFDWLNTALHPGANPILDAFFSTITVLGNGGIFWILLSLALFIPRKTRKISTVMMLSLFLCAVVNNGILKNIFDRPRPFDLDLGWWLSRYVYPGLIQKPDSPSFPSGHTATSFACAFGFLFGLHQRRGASAREKIAAAVLLLLATLIGFSRIYLQVHYATDVLFAALSGIVCALLGYVVLRLFMPLYERIDAQLNDFLAKHIRFIRFKGAK
jgi:undecaprenyl-diphosphatase